MDNAYITGKMNAYMHQLNAKACDWLMIHLPQITDNWWNELVYSNLSQLQREQIDKNTFNDLKILNLSTLLQIIDRNWFVITSSFFINNKYRQQIKNMLEVCNRWVHITSDDLHKERIINDVETIIGLMQTFDASITETRDMESFLMEVEDDNHIQTDSLPVVFLSDLMPTVNSIKENAIVPGSMITLVSDPSKAGAVVAIDNNKYTVWMDNTSQTFYKEQIQLKPEDVTPGHLSLKKVRSALTAYQINNPGANNLYSLNSARIDFVPYQFRPALKIIKADTPRLLVADDVGVGKTIEAGLILKEMEARGSVDSVLIICPRPLVAERKWELEMKRFDENFTQLDGKELQRCILETERDREWPERHKKAIIPYSLFSEDMLLGTESRSDKKRKQLGLQQLDPVPHFDLVIIDEAHNIRNNSTWAYQGVEFFTRDADAVVLLTATPLQNSTNDLYTLLNLIRPDIVLDKDTFETMSEPNAYVNNLLRAVRNQNSGWQSAAKDEIKHILNTSWGRNVIQHNPNFEKVFDYTEKETLTREQKIEAISLTESLHSFNNIITRTRRQDIEDFCVRHTQTVRVSFTPEQQDLYDALMEFESNTLMHIHGSRSVRFMMCTIMRQAASCIYGLAPFVKDIVQKKLAQIQEDGELFEYDFEMNSDLENSIFELADELYNITSALPNEDPKLEKLYQILDQKQKEANNRIILFSSFRHTLGYINKHLTERGYRVAQVDGSVPDEERYRIRERFLMDSRNDDAVDVLLFSEVGCEGLDYQFCDTMINYDLPWNPMRIEQRIGRIDRRGQKSESVRIYNIITDGTIDAVIYDRCLTKIGVFESSIGDCAEILGDISEQIFKIMFDPGLSDEERHMKIEKMADNEVMKVRELNKLEQEERVLYGFDLSNYIQNKNVQDAENEWINPDSISDLVDTFLSNILGSGEYIKSSKNNAFRTLRLSGDKKKSLLDILKKSDIKNFNNAGKVWNAYLNSSSSLLRITYDPSCAKDNRDITFLTQMHPLVLQAAKHESQQFPCEAGVRISNESIPSGDYEFLIYAWKNVGLRPDIKLVAVSNNVTVQENILNFIQYASDYAFDSTAHISCWNNMDKIHHAMWQSAKTEYENLVKAECNFRIEQLHQTITKRESIIKSQINKAISEGTDERIIRMRNSQLDNLHKKYREQQQLLESTLQKADIHTQLLVKGVLHVD